MAQEKPKTAKLDPAMDVNRAARAGVVWHDVTQWGIEGRILPDQQRERWFDRLPASAKGEVTSNVWNLSRDSAGMMVRFETDSPSIHVQYKLMDDNLALPHMPATGVSGADLYARNAEGKWRWVQVAKPDKQEVTAEIIRGLAPGMREAARAASFGLGADHAVVGLVFVADQLATPVTVLVPIGAEERNRVLRASPDTEVVDHPRHRIEGAPRISPDVGPLGLASTRV